MPNKEEILQLIKANMPERDYFLRISIQDHIKEVDFLYNHKYKYHEYKYLNVPDKWEQELADLYILLEIYFSKPSKKSIFDGRLKRFLEKMGLDSFLKNK